LGDKRIVLLLPGSRPAEIAMVCPTFEAAAGQLCTRDHDLVVVSVLAGSVAGSVRERAEAWPFPHLLVEEEEKEDAFAAAEIAIACSGTVATELALQGTPMIVGYRLGALTAFIILNFMLKSRFVTLVNIALDQEIVPELIQNELTPDAIVREGRLLLDSPEARQRQKTLLEQALIKMGRDDPPMAERAAQALLNLMRTA
jgi:lipid-A-disaccharide synthase